MLSGLLTTIQSQFGKALFLTSVFPLLLFAIACAWLSDDPGITKRSESLVGTNPTVQAMVAVAALLVGGYLLSSLLPFLAELLEGKHTPWLGYLLPRTEQERFRSLDSRLKSSRRKLRDLEIAKPPNAKPPFEIWQEELRDAYLDGLKQPSVVYPGSSVTARAVERLRHYMTFGRDIDLLEMKCTIALLTTTLEKNNSGLASPDAIRLGEDHETTLEAINYLRERYRAQALTLFHLQQFGFPFIPRNRGENEANVLVSTRFGNISRTARAYTLSRYGMDLDIFWTRLQRAIQGEEKFNNALQDSKAQADFLVAMCWLSAASTAFWSIRLATHSGSTGKFLIVSIAGPVLTRVFYLMACYSQRIFTDQLRSAVDLFRFTLLQQLHVPLPPNSELETELWTELRYAVGSGDNEVGISYKHPA